MCQGASSASVSEAVDNFNEANNQQTVGRADYDGGNQQQMAMSEANAQAVAIGNSGITSVSDDSDNNNIPAAPPPSPIRTGIKNVFKNEENYNKFIDNYKKSAGYNIGNAIKGVMGAGPMSLAMNALGMSNKSQSGDSQIAGIMAHAAQNPEAVTLGEDGLSLSIDTGNGTVNMSSNGFTTYSGMPDDDYSGPFANLVNSPAENDGSDAPEPRPQTPLDPCPAGFAYNSATQSCEKVATTQVAETSQDFSRTTSPFDLSMYGRQGGERLFFNEMPGIIKAKDGLPRHPNGEVKGPGGPKDDLVGPIMLSSQEYVEPYERVLDEGNGNYERGIRVLEQKRMAALRKYRDRVKSEERNRG